MDAGAGAGSVKFQKFSAGLDSAFLFTLCSNVKNVFSPYGDNFFKTFSP